MFRTEQLIVEVPDLKIKDECLYVANKEIPLQFVEEGDGGVVLSYSVKVYEVRDDEDNLVASLMLDDYGTVCLYVDEVEALKEFIKEGF